MITPEKMETIQQAFMNEFIKGLPCYNDFKTDAERNKYLYNTYGLTLNELLAMGIDPFK